MDIQIRPVKGDVELAAVRRLRYDVYVRELGRQQIGGGSADGEQAEAEDNGSIVYAAFDDDVPVASLRMTPVHTLDPDSPWHAFYGFKYFPVPTSVQVVLSRLVVRPDQRATMVAPQLLAAAYDAFRGAGGELIFLRCAANMVSLYEVIGWRRYKPGAEDGEAGFRVPMVMITGDWTYFEAVKSPLLDNVQLHAPNLTIGDWFEVEYPEYSRPATVRVLGRDEFLLSFAQRLNDSSIPLLDDLKAAERKQLFASAAQRKVKRGEMILGKGGTDTDMFLISDGAVEVSESVRGQRRQLTTLGAGQLFGEAAFLMQTPRTADVTAITDTDLVVLGVEAFAKLGEAHPKIALKVLRNLSRTLCMRLYAHNAN